MSKRNVSTENNGRVILDLDRHVPYFFTNISNRLSYGASKTYTKYFGIGITEWRVMAVLAGQPNISANQICAAVGMDKAAVSRSLRSLDRDALVTIITAPTDSRSNSIALSDAGRALHDRLIKVALERERLLLSCLSPIEVEGLISALRKIRAQVRVVNAYDPKIEGAGRSAAVGGDTGDDAVRRARAKRLLRNPSS